MRVTGNMLSILLKMLQAGARVTKLNWKSGTLADDTMQAIWEKKYKSR
jgi:hypothetical protein